MIKKREVTKRLKRHGCAVLNYRYLSLILKISALKY